EAEIEACGLQLRGLDRRRGGDRARLHERRNALAREETLVVASHRSGALQRIVRLRKARAAPILSCRIFRSSPGRCSATRPRRPSAPGSPALSEALWGAADRNAAIAGHGSATIPPVGWCQYCRGDPPESAAVVDERVALAPPFAASSSSGT